MQKIVIIGGGLSGLSTAYLIKKQIDEHKLNAEVIVVEKDNRLGGKIQSTSINGYLCEWAANGFLNNKSQTLELCKSLGIFDKLVKSNDNARKRFVYASGKLHKLPHSLREFLASSILSLGGKLRITKEFFIPKRVDKSDESLADFATRRIGKEALQRLITPMACGIFAGDPSKMSLKACFPKIYQLEEEHGSLLKALFKPKKRSGKINHETNPKGLGVLVSFDDGLEVLTDSLAENVGEDNIIRGGIIENIRYNHQQKKYLISMDADELEADYLVCATPSYIASELLFDVDSILSSELNKISYSPLVVVCLGYDASLIEADLSGFGFLLASGEEIPVLGSLWESSIFMGRAPDGKVLFRTMLGGALKPELCDLNDNSLQTLVEDSLAQILNINIKPDFAQIYRHPQAIPAYDLGHTDLVSRIMDQSQQNPNLFITGNAYKGVSVNDCIANSYQTSNLIVDKLMQPIQQ